MNKLQLSLAALALTGTLGLSTTAPASADSAASTRNIILGAAALAGLAIESNVAHKNSQARTISGYLPDGSAVYGDGHVVNRNGYSYYPGNNGRTTSCNNGSCYLANANNGQNGNGNNGQNGNWNNGQNGNWNNGQNGNWNNGQNGNWNNGRYSGDNGSSRDRQNR